MTNKSWDKWQKNIYKTSCINCKDRNIYIYKDDKIMNVSFNGDESITLMIARDSIYLEGFYVRHRKNVEKYNINREDIVKVKY